MFDVHTLSVQWCSNTFYGAFILLVFLYAIIIIINIYMYYFFKQDMHPRPEALPLSLLCGRLNVSQGVQA